jgi:hypothetical protein
MLRAVLTMLPQSRRPSHQRSYAEFVRKTSNRPSAAPTRLWAAPLSGLTIGITHVCTAKVARARTITMLTRARIAWSIEPRTAKKVVRHWCGS